jgi:hypothetical protein
MWKRRAPSTLFAGLLIASVPIHAPGQSGAAGGQAST